MSPACGRVVRQLPHRVGGTDGSNPSSSSGESCANPVRNYEVYVSIRHSTRCLRCGSEMIPEALLAHLAPIGWQHINLTGDYLWDVDVGLAPDGFRALPRTQIEALNRALV